MLENFKRARYFTKFYQENTQRGVQQYTWLKENNWPADGFVDLFRRVHPEGNYLTPYLFKHFIDYQFEWARADDVDSLNKLYEIILEPDYRRQDKANLIAWLKPMVDGAKSRAAEQIPMLAVQFNERSNRYEITHVETKMGERYSIVFTGTETECRNFISTESAYQSGWAIGIGKSQDSSSTPQHTSSKLSIQATNNISANETEIQANAAKKARDAAEILGLAKNMDAINLGQTLQEASSSSKASHRTTDKKKPCKSSLITQDDIDAFGSDLIDLIDRVYRQIFCPKFSTNQSDSYISEIDEETFGSDLIGLITVMACISINRISENPTLLRSMEKFIDTETFGSNLIDLIRRKLLDEMARKLKK